MSRPPDLPPAPPDGKEPGEGNAADFSQVEFRPVEERGKPGEIETALGLLAKAILYLVLGALLLFGTCLVIVASN